MNYPKFFDEVEAIMVQDPLSGFLGTFEGGEYRFSYLDVVKSAGHSCPTVAGAYLCTREGLKVLYPDGRAVRGMIKVEFSEDQTEGVAGVIGSVISNITGATTDFGFKGIGNNFNRTNLMFFSQDIKSSVRFTRLDTRKSVDIIYNPSAIPANAQMQPLMQKIMQGSASDEDKKAFGQFWQERVEKIFENVDTVITIQ